MRARNIKPNFFKSEVLAQCSANARLLFIGLWCMADRAGRLEDRPLRIKAELFPYENIDVNVLLEELASKNDCDGTPSFILRYGEHKKYIQVVNFAKHQTPHIKETASIIPAPSLQKNDDGVKPSKVAFTVLSNTSTRLTPDLHSASTEQAHLIPESLNLTPESKTSSLVSSNIQETSAAEKMDDDKPQDLFSEIVDLLTQNICMVTSQIKADLIRDWIETMPRDWIVEAIKQAALSKARSIKYVDKILQTWVAKYRLDEKPWGGEADGRDKKDGLSRSHRRDPTPEEYERDRSRTGW